ncbi:Bro-N domain-containing protein [Clostridioides difficile]
MSNNLQIFKNNDFGEIRVIELNGEPWFVGKDVAETLGYKDTSDALKRHVDDEDKGLGEILTPGGNQNMKIINESGLYSLILSSKLSTAKKFKHWVTRDVLPSIRKTGTYSTKSKDESEKNT